MNTTAHGAYCSSAASSADEIYFSLYTVLGSDGFADVCERAISLLPNVQNKVVRIEGGTSGCCVVLSGENDRAFITDRGVTQNMKVSDFERSDMLRDQCVHTHIAGYYNCPGMHAELPLLLEELFRQGQSTSLNPQFDALGNASFDCS